jgi:hypothetical protein
MHRRSLLAGLAAGASGASAGCAGLFEAVRGDGPVTDTETSAGGLAGRRGGGSDRAGTGAQSVTVKNTDPGDAYVTVAVERDGRTVFVESVPLVPGQWRTFPRAVTGEGGYDVVVETADGARTTGEWRVDGRLDGLEVVLDHGIQLWPSVRCEGECPVAAVRSAADLPLVGDGSGHWFSPAAVVLQNEGRARSVALRVRLDAETVLDATYALPAASQARVPVTFRSGRYEVEVASEGVADATAWRVPEQPAQYVRFGAEGDTGDRSGDAGGTSSRAGAPAAGETSGVTFGCGPGNTVVRLANSDADAHQLGITVLTPDDGTVQFEETFGLAAGTSRVVEAVRESGPYLLVAATENERVRAPWWACPPHGPVDVEVDATGAIGVRQGFRGYIADADELE